MKVLVACEESQTVCKAFRESGHEAYSCDIQEPSGGHPEWHILGDALVAIEGGQVTTMDGQTLEINRCCTDGTKNACSILYAAAWRAAKALGYERIVTYTRESEPGTSLRAAGFHCDGSAGGTHWTGERYIQQEIVLDEMKVRWSKEE